MSSIGDATPRMMVLGLVIQQPDTVSGVARRLADQFASARFSPSSAYTNVPSLAREGHLRLVEEGPERPLDRYEATPAGVAHFHEWLRSLKTPPVIRDVLQGKLEFMEPKGLATLILEVREQERAHRAACEVVHGRLRQEQEARRRIRSRGKPVDWRVRLRGIQTKDELALWSTMIHRLELLREDLEELQQELSTGGSGSP